MIDIKVEKKEIKV